MKCVAYPISPEVQDISRVYHSFLDVFSQAKALGLPQHRLYDCNIDLLPKTSTLQSIPIIHFRTTSLDDYIQQALQQGNIVPSMYTTL